MCDKICGTCRWHGFRDYNAANKFSVCDRIMDDWESDKENGSPRPAAYVKGSGWGGLITTTDFGCNLWEPKTNE